MIKDEFTDLYISRQRKKQLRWKRDGKCIVCGKFAVTSEYCEEHRKKHISYVVKKIKNKK